MSAQGPLRAISSDEGVFNVWSNEDDVGDLTNDLRRRVGLECGHYKHMPLRELPKRTRCLLCREGA